MRIHVKGQCNKRIVSCSAKDVMCISKGSFEDIMIHQKSCLFVQLKPALSRSIELEKTVKEGVSRIIELEKTVKSLQIQLSAKSNNEPLPKPIVHQNSKKKPFVASLGHIPPPPNYPYNPPIIFDPSTNYEP